LKKVKDDIITDDTQMILYAFWVFKKNPHIQKIEVGQFQVDKKTNNVRPVFGVLQRDECFYKTLFYKQVVQDMFSMWSSTRFSDVPILENVIIGESPQCFALGSFKNMCIAHTYCAASGVSVPKYDKTKAQDSVIGYVYTNPNHGYHYCGHSAIGPEYITSYRSGASVISNNSNDIRTHWVRYDKNIHPVYF
jgi:hypothetical protein